MSIIFASGTGQNMANGFATGLDLRLHGEIVEDADSWVSSLVCCAPWKTWRATVPIDTDPAKSEPHAGGTGNIRRPTDQVPDLWHVLFRDYMPGNKISRYTSTFCSVPVS